MARPRTTPDPESVVLEATEARSTLGRILDEELEETKMRAGVRRVMYELENGDNPLAAVRALDKLLSQAKGTPKQTHTVEMNMKVAAIRTAADLQALTDEELAMVAAGAGAARAALPIGGASA